MTTDGIGRVADVLIVDSNGNLDVYRDAKDDNDSHQCCGEGVEIPGSEKSPSCCGSGEPAHRDAGAQGESEAMNFDFNKWAGVYHRC